jgi:hypothetical protein
MLTHSSKQTSQVAQTRPTSYITVLGIVVTLVFCSIGLKALRGPYVEVHYVTQVTVQNPKGEIYQQNLLNTAQKAAVNDAAIRAVTERELTNVIGVLEHAEEYQMLNSSLPHGYSGEDYQMNHGDSVVPPTNTEGHQAHEKTVIPSSNEGATGSDIKLKDNDLTYQQGAGNIVQKDRLTMTSAPGPIAQFAVQYRRRGTTLETGKVAGPSFDIKPCKLLFQPGPNDPIFK